MKRFILFLISIVLCSSLLAQNIKLKLSTEVNGAGDTVKISNQGAPLKKGDIFTIWVSAAGNGNTVTRQLYFDFQYQNTAFELLGFDCTGTGGNGGVLPSGATFSTSYYQYPGYSYKQSTSNTTTDGNVNYQNADYNYLAGGNQTIVRANLTWTSSNGMPYGDYWSLIKLTFRAKTTALGFNFDPIRMNFAAAWNNDGSYGSTTMQSPLSIPVYIDPTSESLVNATIEKNSAIDAYSLTRVAFIDSATNETILVDANDNGSLAIDQSRLKENTTYKVTARINADAAKEIFNAAVTVSDYTAVQAEFTNQNLDGTFTGSNVKTGMGYYAADVTKNKIFDGGDIVRIFAQSVGRDTLYVLPSNYSAGTDIYIDVPTLTDSLFNNVTTSTWKNIDNSFTYFKTGLKGSNKRLKLKYVIPGDVNRSHSSQVVAPDNTIKSYSISAINTPNKAITTIDVNLNNLTVTSNTIEIPVNIKALTDVSALQFEFTYDPTKIKFEELASTLPNTWYTFATPRDGKIKFGSINKELKETITGDLVPFKLKFSAIENGLNLATQIKVSPVMDASDNKGNQLGINLNTTSIKLTGYNNF